MLAVEILSPSSVGIDRLLKRDVYARLGVPGYWTVDLDEPSVTMLVLRDGVYQEQSVVRGEELAEVDEPFRISFLPSDLVRSR